MESKKRAVGEKRIQQGGFSLQGAGVAAGCAGEGWKVEMRRVGQRIHFQMAPGEFDGIQIGGVGGQEIGLRVGTGGEKS